MQINNMDIYSFVKDVRNYANTIAKSESAIVDHLTDVDKERFLSYPDALMAKLERIQSHPNIDTPRFSPHQYDIGELFDFSQVREDGEAVSNSNIVDMLNLYAALEYEALNSESSRLSNRVIPADLIRFQSILDKGKMIITDYIAIVGDVDTPEKQGNKK